MKRFVSIICVLCMILSMSTICYAAESSAYTMEPQTADMNDSTVIDIKDAKVLDLINSIADVSKRDKIHKFWSTPAYSTVITNEENDRNLSRIEPEYDEAESFELIAELAQLPNTELDQRIEEIAKETIEEHINNSEILWDESFSDQYGAEYISQLKLQNEQFLLQHMNSLDGNMLLAVSEKSFTTTSTVFGTANQKLFDFKVTTRFGYNGTDVQYLVPSSKGTIYSGDWTYQGVDSSYGGQELFMIPNVGIAGDVDKKGLFKRAIFQTTSYTIIHQRCLGDGTYVGNVIY